MKKIAVLALILFSAVCLYAQSVEIDDCLVTRYYTYDKGSSRTFSAYGNVFVEIDPSKLVDLKVQIVNQSKFSDFCVYRTTDTPQNCCEWRFVNDRSKARFTIRYVKDHADCYVYFVKDRKDARTNYLVRSH